MATANPVVIDRLLAGQLDLLRLDAHARQQVFGLLSELESELVSRLQDGNLTAFGKARLEQLLGQADTVVHEFYSQASDAMDGVLGGAAKAQAALVSDSIDVALAAASVDTALPPTSVIRALVSDLLVMGAQSSDWWDKQAEDTTFRFAAAVRQGVAQGETVEQIAARVAGPDGFMEVARSNARALVHTSIMEVAAEARKETYKQNDDVVEGTMQLSTLDSHTTDICIAYSGAEYDLDGEPLAGTDLPYDGGVPRHWGCRSVEVPITKTFKELGIDIPEPDTGDRASADGPVPADTTFEGFLDRMGKNFQDETLGPGRAELWRDGTITLQQLLDLRGNPLTLAQLEAKYA